MVRILHVIENFNGQAVESWLSRMVNHQNSQVERLHFDFFLLGNGEGRNALPLINRGCILHGGDLSKGGILNFARALRSVVKEGNYDVVHIHQDVMAGVFSVALLGTRVSVITHVHNCWQKLPVGGRVKNYILTAIAKFLALRLSHAVIGVSREALQKMTSGKRLSRRIDRVIFCSAKVCPNKAPNILLRQSCGYKIRKELRIAKSSKVILFLGRLDDYKNPVQALALLGEFIACGAKSMVLVVAGVGGLHDYLRQIAAEKGIELQVRLIGWVDEVQHLLLGVDLLIMPSKEFYSEGLGLVAVEAQAAGTPVLASRSLSVDAIILPALVKRISLDEKIDFWRKTAQELFDYEYLDFDTCWREFNNSPFTDKASYAALSSLYEEVVKVDSGSEVRLN